MASDLVCWKCGASLADLTLPYGRVVYDYNKEANALAQAAE